MHTNFDTLLLMLLEFWQHLHQAGCTRQVGGTQVERTLTMEQKRLDFKPMAGAALPLDQPTDACLLASSLIDALLRFASATLQATNLTSFCAEVIVPSTQCNLQVFLQYWQRTCQNTSPPSLLK